MELFLGEEQPDHNQKVKMNDLPYPSVILRKPAATVPNAKLESVHLMKCMRKCFVYILEQLRHAKGRHEDR